MKPYWITFEAPPLVVLNLGMGITAQNEADAIMLARSAVADIAIREIREVNDVAELDQGHVIPNMSNMLKRGIWFPLGYED
jgi:hypothetical protein